MLKIHKLIAKNSSYSLRKAEELIKTKRVLVNQNLAFIGQYVTENDLIEIDQQKLEIKKQLFVYYLLNKPLGIVSSTVDPQGRKTVTDLVKSQAKIYPIGRLDIDTTGLIILTNDGALTYALSHPKFEIKKTYLASLDKVLSFEELKELNSPKTLVDNAPSFHHVEHLGKKLYKVVLHQGKNHHVKKLFATQNRLVLKLHRSRFAFLNARNLKIGEYRKLSPLEIKKLYQMSHFKENENSKRKI